MSEEKTNKTIEEINHEKKDRTSIWKERGVKLIVFILVSILFSILFVSTQSSVTFTIGNPEPEMPVSEPPEIFYYKNDTFEHRESNGYRVIYEFIDSERHIVASEPVGEGFISPLFKDKAEAIIYQQLYFDYLRTK